MARSITDYDGTITPVDSDYPNGDWKNNTGGYNGTWFNRKSAGDVWQFFMKLMRIAGITANGIPDNEYNGFQFVNAAKVAFKRYQKTYYLGGGTGLTLPINEQSILYLDPGAIGGQSVQLPTTANVNPERNSAEGTTIRVQNDSSHTIAFLSDTNIGYLSAPPYIMPANAMRSFTLISGFWVISSA